ncbi:M20 metallopeptidase family protein [Acidaminobacter hydrogenoformans]|uniref:Peptidase dimerisation domain-containing protein n=1 Tax=Acidaminobacter hydrogenoformans DSM 2784 TaxID=1120920 RepID=A0A1G5S5G9_9FIRM|nr:amidohydrolase [Acidaminobacter hydrogenoformans]SCZ81594.1 Peptidase dimerisation domain-containing protein [Acidaminobacter hydrogenoformans DSM 2784]
MLSYSNILKRSLDLEISSVADRLIDWRRHLHQHPELSSHEYQTREYIRNSLIDCGNFIFYPVKEPNLIAAIKGNKPGSKIAFKADLDALPIQELVNHSFSSSVPEVMHACGHDAHIAILLGLANVLSKMKDKIEGEIILIFQSAEEIPPSGADDIISTHVLDDIEMIFDLHVNPEIESGIIATKPGPITASIDQFEIEITGQGGHASHPHESIDTIVIGSEIVLALQNIISRKTNPLTPRILTITQFMTPQLTHGLIPSKVILKGNLRTVDDDSRYNIKKLLEKMANGIADAYEAKTDIRMLAGYNATINSEDLALFVEKVAREYLPDGSYRRLAMPYLVGDSFSKYTDHFPGCFISLGVKLNNIDTIEYCHSNRFDIDESSLQNGLKLLTYIAARKTMSLL